MAEQLKEAHKKQYLTAIDTAMASLKTAASQDIYHAQSAGAGGQQQGAQQPGESNPPKAEKRWTAND